MEKSVVINFCSGIIKIDHESLEETFSRGDIVKTLITSAIIIVVFLATAICRSFRSANVYGYYAKSL